MKLTKHQSRVLAAMLALESKHAWPWWSRDAIGYVVGAGGFHDTIQRRTMLALRNAGLIMLERASWPESVRKIVRCNCACYDWGLTDKGRDVARSLAIRWPADTLRRIALSVPPRDDPRGDDRLPPDFDDDADDDDGPSPAPTPTPLVPAFA